MEKRGKILGICTSVDTGTKKRNMHQANLIKNFGVEGDAHGGFYTDSQVSLLPVEKIKEFSVDEDAVIGSFGENLVVQGLDFSDYPIGARFRSGDVLLELTHRGKEDQPNQAIKPCLLKKEGLFFKVILGGIITEGDYLHAED